MDRLKTRIWDIIHTSVIITGIVIILCVDVFVPSIKRGFWCGDSTLTFSYKGDTITDVVLGVIVFAVVPIINVIEGLLKGFKNVNPMLTYGYGYGVLITGIIAYSLHCLVGEPRPHFFESCQPDAAVSCKIGTFVELYECKLLTKISLTKAFPSAHSAFGMYHAIFLAWYLERRFIKVNYREVFSVLKALIILWGLYVGISRILDNRHHWWDVVAGFLVGAVVAFYTCLSLCRNFKLPESRSQKSNEIMLGSEAV